jgi:hypothetical protein
MKQIIFGSPLSNTVSQTGSYDPLLRCRMRGSHGAGENEPFVGVSCRLGLAEAEAVCRGFPIVEAQVDPESSYVAFVVNKSSLGRSTPST